MLGLDVLSKGGAFQDNGRWFNKDAARPERTPPMDISTPHPVLLATPFAGGERDWDQRVSAWLAEVGAQVQRFLAQGVTPTRCFQFERDLYLQVRGLGRILLEWTLNHVEAEEPPAQVCVAHEWYRRRPKSPRRNLDSLFGPVRLWRYRYEAATPGEPSRFPLEERLGLQAQRATPALAERAAWWSVGHTQAQVLAVLRRDHGVCWSVATLRGLTQSLSAGLAEHREAAQLAKLQTWLQAAEASAGPHRPVLSVGRDGVMVPVRGDTEYREAATGTLSVLDRRGRRVGTVYLGRMPEKGQKTLSRQMTRLITRLLAALVGPLPRLHYVTDGGHEPTRYFRQVLRKLPDPRRLGRLLSWTWVIDFYHACGYITKMSEALWSQVCAATWARKMRHWLRDKRNGVFRVLHSAAALRSRRRRQWTRAEQKAFADGYRYLRKRKPFMDYAAYRARGLPIGSGITEAACKTVFTQRLKQSGMTWGVEGGQTIVDLRTLWLSGVWEEVYDA
jgi:hypothetical protein